MVPAVLKQVLALKLDLKSIVETIQKEVNTLRESGAYKFRRSPLMTVSPRAGTPLTTLSLESCPVSRSETGSES